MPATVTSAFASIGSASTTATQEQLTGQNAISAVGSAWVNGFANPVVSNSVTSNPVLSNAGQFPSYNQAIGNQPIGKLRPLGTVWLGGTASQPNPAAISALVGKPSGHNASGYNSTGYNAGSFNGSGLQLVGTQFSTGYGSSVTNPSNLGFVGGSKITNGATNGFSGLTPISKFAIPKGAQINSIGASGSNGTSTNQYWSVAPVATATGSSASFGTAQTGQYYNQPQVQAGAVSGYYTNTTGVNYQPGYASQQIQQVPIQQAPAQQATYTQPGQFISQYSGTEVGQQANQGSKETIYEPYYVPQQQAQQASYAQQGQNINQYSGTEVGQQTNQNAKETIYRPYYVPQQQAQQAPVQQAPVQQAPVQQASYAQAGQASQETIYEPYYVPQQQTAKLIESLLKTQPATPTAIVSARGSTLPPPILTRLDLDGTAGTSSISANQLMALIDRAGQNNNQASANYATADQMNAVTELLQKLNAQQSGSPQSGTITLTSAEFMELLQQANNQQPVNVSQVTTALNATGSQKLFTADELAAEVTAQVDAYKGAFKKPAPEIVYLNKKTVSYKPVPIVTQGQNTFTTRTNNVPVPIVTQGQNTFTTRTNNVPVPIVTQGRNTFTTRTNNVPVPIVTQGRNTVTKEIQTIPVPILLGEKSTNTGSAKTPVLSSSFAGKGDGINASSSTANPANYSGDGFRAPLPPEMPHNHNGQTHTHANGASGLVNQGFARPQPPVAKGFRSSGTQSQSQTHEHQTPQFRPQFRMPVPPAAPRFPVAQQQHQHSHNAQRPLAPVPPMPPRVSAFAGKSALEHQHSRSAQMPQAPVPPMPPRTSSFGGVNPQLQQNAFGAQRVNQPNGQHLHYKRKPAPVVQPVARPAVLAGGQRPIINNNYNDIRVHVGKGPVSKANLKKNTKKPATYPLWGYTTGKTLLRRCPKWVCIPKGRVDARKPLYLTGCNTSWCSVQFKGKTYWVERRFVGIPKN